MTIREALKGYGSGLETTMAGAYGRAVADYDRRYKVEVEERMVNFRAQEDAKRQSFQAALTAWGKTGTTARGSGTGGQGGSGGEGGYPTPTGNIGHYTPQGEWREGRPDLSRLGRR